MISFLFVCVWGFGWLCLFLPFESLCLVGLAKRENDQTAAKETERK